MCRPDSADDSSSFFFTVWLNATWTSAIKKFDTARILDPPLPPPPPPSYKVRIRTTSRHYLQYVLDYVLVNVKTKFTGSCMVYTIQSCTPVVRVLAALQLLPCSPASDTVLCFLLFLPPHCLKINLILRIQTCEPTPKGAYRLCNDILCSYVWPSVTFI